jgi:hypothetical protein
MGRRDRRRAGQLHRQCLPRRHRRRPGSGGIEQDIANIQQNNGPRGEIHTEYRSRAGETGLSQLSEMKADAELSTGLGRGRCSPAPRR